VPSYNELARRTAKAYRRNVYVAIGTNGFEVSENLNSARDFTLLGHPALSPR
jgi:hypothetical protein